MTAVDDIVSYGEASEQDEVRSIPLAHLSIEVGHFYMDELLNGPDPVRSRFAAARPWLTAARESLRVDHPRVSTCFLVDDYFFPETSPAEIMPRLLSAAREAGVEIDYIAREAGCQRADSVDVASLAAQGLVEEPPPKTNGSRPQARLSGWLANGRRPSPAGSDEAMRTAAWQPAEEFGRRNHSIFLDVEMWRGDGPDRLWSCPFLAGVWHLLRLGVLRHHNEPVAQPVPRAVDEPWPESWSDLPAVMQIRENAQPFSAYRAVSILPRTYLPIEHAIRVILEHLTFDDAVLDELVRRGAAEGLVVPRPAVERLAHVFLDG
jgi:hypothetical protein